MKRIVLLFSSAVALFTAIPASAQSYYYGGLLVDRDIVTPEEIYELTQTTFTFGTARSMSMAGAFTSLGADLSSMATNPAGLGMYRRSELSITPLMTFARAENNAPGYLPNRKNRFSLGNFGFTFNVYEGAGTVASVNIGFGYNRLQDLNYRFSHYTTGNKGSIGDAFSLLLQAGNKGIGDLYDGSTDNVRWGDLDPMYWGAAAGYYTGLTDDVDGQWSPTWIGRDADIGQYTDVISTGSVGEYAFSAGANLGNKFYLGATLGVQSVSQRKRYHYYEDYYYGGEVVGVDPNLEYQLLNAGFDQETTISGAGVNLKVGAIYRPVEGLRIGLAIHTPTWYSLDRRYRTQIDTYSRENSTGSVEERWAASGWSYNERWEFTSPTRLLAGISYAFGNRGVISVDYQRDWYNGVRMQHNPLDEANNSDSGIDNDNAYKNHVGSVFRNQYRGADIVRVGAEFRPHPAIALRAGFGYMNSGLKKTSLTQSAPMLKQMLYYSGGVGFMLSQSVSLDLAYSYSDTKYTDYDLFYFESGGSVMTSNTYNTKMNRHSAAITLGIRW